MGLSPALVPFHGPAVFGLAGALAMHPSVLLTAAFLASGFLAAALLASALLIWMFMSGVFMPGVLVELVGNVVLRFHEVLLELFFGIPAPPCGVPQLPGRLRSMGIKVGGAVLSCLLCRAGTPAPGSSLALLSSLAFLLVSSVPWPSCGSTGRDCSSISIPPWWPPGCGLPLFQCTTHGTRNASALGAARLFPPADFLMHQAPQRRNGRRRIQVECVAQA
ncbi:hypothetical protein QF031_003609 [Pseudarthrobacter defluvii]|uniref:hypothetical protein n=1 Tax=Pseudarthrobacter defluvii TaxID=410837 RepID=UPI00277FF5AA|nr:hypothetical protein [Pseudarthrobacter defluvii]MDQ0770860.1 hypothetical protein [Pseudarthrobacter defluvii]